MRRDKSIDFARGVTYDCDMNLDKFSESIGHKLMSFIGKQQDSFYVIYIHT